MAVVVLMFRRLVLLQMVAVTVKAAVREQVTLEQPTQAAAVVTLAHPAHHMWQVVPGVAA